MRNFKLHNPYLKKNFNILEMQKRLWALLAKYFRRRRDLIKAQYNRVVPLNELLTDRWEKASYLGFGKATSIYDSSIVFGNVKVGRNTWIGPNTILDGTGGLTIGDNCSISAGVHIYSHNTVKWAVSGGQSSYEYKETSIGNCCFIGPQAIIQNGVRIGDHCIIAANSFVNTDVANHTIIGGSPGRILGSVEIDANGEVLLKYLRSE